MLNGSTQGLNTNNAGGTKYGVFPKIGVIDENSMPSSVRSPNTELEPNDRNRQTYQDALDLEIN